MDKKRPLSPNHPQPAGSKSPKRAKAEEVKLTEKKKDDLPTLKVIPPKQRKESPTADKRSGDLPVKITLTLNKPQEKPKPELKKSAVEVLDKMHFEPGDKERVEKAILESKNQKSMVINDARLLKTPANCPENYLGHVIYTGARTKTPHSNRAADLQLFLLPAFTAKHHYCTIEVRIPAEFLTYRGNVGVRKSAIWGTDVYTDDSDVVASIKINLVIIHSGHYRPVDAPDPSPEESTHIAHTGHKDESKMKKNAISSPVEPLIAEAEQIKTGSNILHPDHDLQVTLRVLPKLIKYTGSKRFGLDSRGWGGSHDGESVQVEKVVRIERGSVGKRGRKVFSKVWGELAKQVTKDVEEWVPYEGGVLERVTVEDDASDLTLVFSRVNGEPCIKYSPLVMNEWPSHILNALDDQHDQPLPFTRQVLVDKKDWPLWRLKLLHYNLVMESQDGTRYHF